MQQLRKALLVKGSSDLRVSILGDLRGYFTDQYFASVPPNEEAARETVAVWCINLLWYAYLQAEGFAYPVQVVVAGAAPPAPAAGRHLDFGSGVGVTSQLFHSLGFAPELVDVENGLLAFARYRLERRGIDARYIPIGKQWLEPDSYDAITAIDSLMLVPDFQTAARQIRDATRMGGFLFANFDTRRGANVGWDILYHDDYWLRQQLQGVGFQPELKLGGGVRRYRAVETHGVRHLLRGALDAVLFPTRRSYWAARARLSIKRPLAS